jgi:phage terminase small subunit
VLTPKQQRFVAEYLVDLNATQAAIRAGYSKRTANEQGSRLLANASVRAAVEAGKARQLETADLTAIAVLEEMRRVGFSDLADAFDESGALKPVRELPKAFRAALASVKVTKKNLTSGDGKTEDIVELRLWDKPTTLANLAKHFGLLKENVQHHGEVRIKWAS